MLDARDSYWGTAPPEPRTRMGNWPTVLFSWWCTSFATTIIITRVLGRKVRNNKLFREDWIMLIALAPLWIRMVFVHFVLTYGTNNVDTLNHKYTDEQIYKRSIGSRLVLAARIFFAMFIWLSKWTVSEFLKRITIRIWRRSYEITLQGIRIFLFLTFGAVVVATLTECRDFEQYWQVVPDPGPQCRKGFAQLITMGTCDIVTDIVLIAFPIPVVLRSGQSWQRKLQMVSLFSLSIILIGVTATRMPAVVGTGGRQQYRTLWASAEILASAFVANAVTLGSFLRDKGAKKNKYKGNSALDSMNASARRPTLPTVHQTESDEDLFRSLGFGIPAHLQHRRSLTPRPAPPALSAAEQHENRSRAQAARKTTQERKHTEHSSDSDESDHEEAIQAIPDLAPTQSRSQSIAFNDVGNLLDNSPRQPGLQPHSTMGGSSSPSAAAHDALRTQPSSGSRAFMRDVGGMLNHDLISELRSGRLSPRRHHESFWSHHNRDRSQPSNARTTAPTGILTPTLERQETHMSLQDAGGLLDSSSAKVYVTAPDATGEGIELQDVGQALSDALRDVSPRRSRERDRTAYVSSPSPQFGGPDDMILYDPGGLGR